MRQPFHCFLVLQVDDLDSEKLPFTMSLDSLQHPLLQEIAYASYFLADYHRQYFFIFHLFSFIFLSFISFLLSFKICTGHLKFHSNPLSYKYLSVGPLFIIIICNFYYEFFCRFFF